MFVYKIMGMVGTQQKISRLSVTTDIYGVGKKEKKEGTTKFCLKAMCSHSEWANELTPKTELHKPFCLSVQTFVYYY